MAVTVSSSNIKGAIAAINITREYASEISLILNKKKIDIEKVNICLLEHKKRYIYSLINI